MSLLMRPFFLVNKDNLLSELKNVQTMLDMYDYEDNQDGGVEVRIRFFDGDVDFYWGDSQFDTDHRGVWASGYVSTDLDTKGLDELAEQMIDELEDQPAK